MPSNFIRTALITGATGAIGQAVVRRLFNSGMKIVAIRNSNQVPPELEGLSGIHWIETDFNSNNYIETLEPYLTDVNILVHCAGVAHATRIENQSLNDITEEVNVNLVSAILLVSIVVRNAIRLGFGRIVLIGSVTAINGAPGLASYSATKAGLEAVTRSVNREIQSLKQTKENLNLGISTIRPGYVNSKLTESVPQKIRDFIIKRSAIRRFLDADEIAKVIQQIVEEEGNIFCGSIIDINGGQTL